MTTTPDTLAELEVLLREATPGPWHWTTPAFEDHAIGYLADSRDMYVLSEWADYAGDSGLSVKPVDAALIAAAINALPDLLRRVREAEANASLMAATQCPTAYPGEGGGMGCRERDALRADYATLKAAYEASLTENGRLRAKLAPTCSHTIYLPDCLGCALRELIEAEADNLGLMKSLIEAEADKARVLAIIEGCEQCSAKL